jgi:membrane protein required for colicin V production
MPTLDLVLLIFLGAFILYGFYLGLVKMILHIISTVLSIIVSIKFYEQLYDLIPFIGFGSSAMGKVLSFIIILTVSSYILNLAFTFIAKILKVITSLPIVSFVNRFLGGVLGLIQGLFVLGAIVFIASRYSISNEFLNSLVGNSDVAPILIKVVSWVEPFIPTAIDTVEAVII